MPKQFYNPPDVFSPVNIYSHGVGFGGALVLAGQAPLDDKGEVVAPDNAEAQCRRVFSELHKTLALARATFADVTYVRAYVTRRSVVPRLMSVAAEIFGEAHPAFTPVIVPGVRAEGALLEVELTVHRPRRRRRQYMPAPARQSRAPQ